MTTGLIAYSDCIQPFISLSFPDYPATDYTAAGDSLLDLGLDMQQSPAVPDDSLGSATNTSASLLDDQFKLLGLDADTTQPNNTTAGSKATTDAQWGVLGPGQSGTQQQQPHPQIQVPTAYYHVNSASMPYAMNMNANMSGQMMAPAMLNTMQSGMMLSSVRPVSSFAASSGASVQTATQQTRPVKPPGNEPKNVYKDPLAFDVFSNFKKDGAKPNLTDAAKGSDETNYVMNTDLVNDATRPVAQPITANDAPIDTLLDFSDYEAKQSKPLSSDGYIVPLEAIEPTSHAPITALDKNGVKTMLNIVKDKRDTANANVIVAVLSTISMNVVAISDFKIEISVPKVMRVKMQAPSSRNLPAFNPLFPPSAITQVILIANPTKETIKMQLRISYKSGENALSETVTIDSLPVTVVDHQESVTFELKGDRLPSSLKGSMRGDLFLTSSKIIFVNKANNGNSSFSMEFRSVKNVDVKQPIFGANALTGYVNAEQGGGWDGSANFRVEFKTGGAIEFAERLKHVAGQARSGHYQPPMQAGYYPPPPLGGYYYAPYNTAYGASQQPNQGPQAAYAPPFQGHGAPPPYSGAAPPQNANESDNAKAREAYSSGQNVYVPPQFVSIAQEQPPPYAPGFNDKKNQ
eukprot:gene8827-9772_t